MSQKLMFLAKDITFMALGSNFEQKPSHPTLILADLGCRPVGYAARFAESGSGKSCIRSKNVRSPELPFGQPSK